MLYSLAALALAGAASAVNVIVVQVGLNGTQTFSPSNFKAQVGDTVEFQFRGGNHTVTQSPFDNPCIPISTINATAKGFHSGYMPFAASQAMGQIPSFRVQITDTKPIWAYCAQGRHCQNGMVMVINENPAANASRTLANYKAAAVNAPAGQGIPGGSATQPGDNGGAGGSGTPSGTDTAPSPTVSSSLASAREFPAVFALAALVAALLSL